MNKFLAICFFCFIPFLLKAQHSAPVSNQLLYRDSLVHLGKRMVNDSDEMARKNANYTFIRTLISALKPQGSFHAGLDSLKMIAVVNSPDSRFRLLTWHVMNDDGSYRFYGAIQMNSRDGQLQLHPLGDYSPMMQYPEDTITDNTRWYGAQYYDIIPVEGARPYYVLLGWKGTNVQSTKKVIEVLSFVEGKPVFGMPVFFNKSKIKERVVFQYTRQASMLLKYDPRQQLIVFDHLAPPNAKMKDHPEAYGPDLSYDAYKLRDGKWYLEENVDVRNVPDITDDQYIDPRRKDASTGKAGKHQ